MAITLAGTAAALNEHHRIYNPSIQQALRVGLEFEGSPEAPAQNRPSNTSLSSVRPVQQTYSSPNVTVNGILQNYQIAFTPNLVAQFDSVDHTLQRAKFDILFDSDDLDKFLARWKVEWADWTAKDPTTWSFPSWMYSNVIVPQLQDDLNLAAWAGVRVAPTVGTAGTVTGSLDGYAKYIADRITAGAVTPVATGVIDPTDMVNHVETFMDGLPAAVRDRPGKVIMSDTLARGFFRDHRAKFGTGNGNGSDSNNSELRIDHTGARVVGVKRMAGSNRFIFCPDNVPTLIHGIKIGESAPLPAIRWEAHERQLKGLCELHRFFGFEQDFFTFVNDQA